MLTGEARVLRYLRSPRPQRGMCQKCRRWRPVHLTEYAPRVVVWALCERCWDGLAPAGRVLFYRNLWARWMRGTGSDEGLAQEIADRWPLIEKAVRAGR